MKDSTDTVQVDDAETLITEVILKAVGPQVGSLSDDQIDEAIHTAVVHMLNGNVHQFVPVTTVIPRDPSCN
ncbi:MAG: hypothetical protein QF793_01850 [Candidatus Peribacteraceae bacterium]|jgi:hypothetical protein|nr:hypothetical protein [bacterium]MDP6561647.1 hypothetical protein [Candidatus Peribacteraceae bacterium]|tara:strand:- start:19848 stop:20060 length:213 start_codon:yes stop_codon:yes gene_type:complete